MATNAPITPIPSGSDASSMPAGLMDKLKPYLPDFSTFYLDPLDPSSDLTFSDRASLAWTSARPWGEFFDLSNFNLPPSFSQWRARLAHNANTFFYNYFWLTVLHVALFAIGHIGPVVVLALYAALAYWLFVAHEPAEEIVLTDSIVVSKNVKLIVAAVAGVVALVFGGVGTLVASVAFFLFVVVGVHGSIREISPDVSEATATTPIAAV